MKKVIGKHETKVTEKYIARNSGDGTGSPGNDSREWCVKYHNTNGAVVEKFYDGTVSVALNTGGFDTATTKRRMNETSEQFDLGFKVFAKDENWFVRIRDGELMPFVDGMVAFNQRQSKKMRQSIVD